MRKPEISLRVPAKREYALVLRLALGGVAILKDLDAGALDDLRSASDEVCDCLLHQAREAEWLELSVYDEGERLTVSIAAALMEEPVSRADCADETEISRAVLETLVPVVRMYEEPCGCVGRIDLTLPKAVFVGA
ncbi:MAG: hypothetical protein ACI4MG_07640 [Aristaeellaceae bacterium]